MGRALGFLFLLALVLPAPAVAQATAPPGPGAPPSLEEVRRGMGIPSEGLTLRGQQDALGFASRPEQMARVWELAAAGLPPTRLGTFPAPGVAGLLAPHDDYIFAGPVYRQLVPLITAKTIVLVGVFHKYRKFGVHDQLVFDPYQAWRTPDGPVPVSKLRDEWLAGIPRAMTLVDPAMHDSEHALEALVYWLKHQDQDIQIIPVIIPAASFDRLSELARAAGSRLGGLMKQRGWKLGRDLAVVISSDGVHYGPDFQHVPFGDGGVEAYSRAVQRDIALLTGPLAGPLDLPRIAQLFSALVDPADPNRYRMTWCGRFSIPFGLLLLEETARALGEGSITGKPLCYATSVGWPALPVEPLGLRATAPSNLYHFVGYPGAAFTVERREAGRP